MSITPQPETPSVIARVAYVVFWAGILISVLLIALTLYSCSIVPEFSDSPFLIAVAAVGSVIPFLIGLAVRYVISGR
jgi:hypothetical protein